MVTNKVIEVKVTVMKIYNKKKYLIIAAMLISLVIYVGINHDPVMESSIVVDKTPLSQQSSRIRPNIVVIVIDALRADHLGGYGYSRDTSPFIDELMQQGIRFENAIANSSYTGESVSSLFTGKFPSSNPYGAGWYARPAPDSNTLAKLFQKSGYKTGLFCDTPVLGPHFYEGFDTTACMVSDFGFSGTGPLVVEKALEFIKNDTNEPFFVYLHFLDPHSPYEPSTSDYLRFSDSIYQQPLRLFEDIRPKLPELITEGFGPGNAAFEDLKLRYDAEIVFVDNCIRSFFESMKKNNMSDNLIVVVTSDHGEEFLDNGFLEHAWRLYWESIHIPLIIWAPDFVVSGNMKEPVSLVDIAPTLLSLAALQFDAGIFDGHSLFTKTKRGTYTPVSHGKPIISELLLQTRPIIRSIIHGDYQYIAAWQWCDPPTCSADAIRQFEWREKLKKGEIQPVDPWGTIVHEELIFSPGNGGKVDNLLLKEPDQVSTFRSLLDNYHTRVPNQVDDKKKLETYKLGTSEENIQQGAQEMRQQMETLGYL